MPVSKKRKRSGKKVVRQPVVMPDYWLPVLSPTVTNIFMPIEPA